MTTELMNEDDNNREVIGTERPSYLTDYEKEDFGTGEILKVVRPPMIKIVQKMSGPPVKPPYTDGEIVVLPMLIRVGGGPSEDNQDPIEFTPIFFFRSWFTWNPLQMKGQLSAIRESSFDENGEIAKKAKGKDTRKEPCPENNEYKIVHCEHLNYITLVDHPDVTDLPMLMSFSRAEYATGSMYGSLIQVRRAPLYCCRFQAVVKDVVGNLGSWKGFDISNAMNPWVDPAIVERNKELFETYKELHESRMIEFGEEHTEVAEETAGNEFS